MKKLVYFLLVTIFFACGNDDQQSDLPEDNFDRTTMLENWANNIIVPAFTAFSEKSNTLKIASDAFVADPSISNYESLVSSWESAYLNFQDVSMFDIGAAESLRFTNNLNIYPTDIEALQNNVLNGGYNLELPDQIAVQGFPALDYLIFGIASDQNEIIAFYQSDSDAAAYLNYLQALTNRIDELSQAVLADWNDSFKADFISNSGNTALASVDKLVNDYIFYYERHLRAGKIGIPAGIFSGSTLSENVEAFYRKDFSKELFSRSLDAVQDFFNGVHYGSAQSGESLKSYLDYLETKKGDLNLSQAINQQFDSARTTAQELDDNFANQVETDNVKMLETYDQLQLNVINIKVDLLQALNINVDYTDADGD